MANAAICQCANWLRCLINVPIGCAFYSLLISGNKIYKKKTQHLCIKLLHLF